MALPDPSMPKIPSGIPELNANEKLTSSGEDDKPQSGSDVPNLTLTPVSIIKPSSHPKEEKDELPVTSGIKLELTTKQKQDIKEAFNAFDVNGTGYMSTIDLKIALRALGFEPRKNEIKKIVEKVDKGNTGRLGFSDFMEVISLKLSEKDSRDEIMKAFKLFDKDQTGFITFENLRLIATELGEGLNDEEVREMIEEADVDHDGAVNQEEFFRIMKKTSLY